jgi:hypothetical protein
MSAPTFELLKTRINNVLSKNPDLINMYQFGNFARSEKVTNLQKRFNWDLFHLAQTNNLDLTDLNDSHIDTALGMICPKIEKKF